MRAADFTFAVGADFTVGASVFASTTVSPVGLWIDAGAIAYSLSFETVDDTLPALANLTISTGLFAFSAVVAVVLEVEAGSLAFGLSRGAVQGTFSITTDFAFAALGSTCAAVLAIVGRVDANTVALTLPAGAGRFFAFALVAVVLRRTVFDLRAELKATSGVLDAELVFARNLRGLCGAFKLTFLALGVRAIRDTFVLFAFFKVFAEGPSGAFSPDSTATFLCAFDACLTVGGQATLCISRCTLHALVFYTSGLAFVGAVFVFEALHTASCAVALQAGRTIFVCTADTLVVLGTFLGGAGFRLAVCVLQTGDTPTFAAAVVQQATFWTILTTGDRHGHFSAAPQGEQEAEGAQCPYASCPNP